MHRAGITACKLVATSVYFCTFATLPLVQADEIKKGDREKCNAFGAQVADAANGVLKPGAGELLLGGAILLASPLIAPRFSMSYNCGVGLFSDKELSVSTNWDGSTPPSEFWVAIGLGGAKATGDNASFVTDAAKKCVNAAISHPEEEMEEANNGKTRVECQAFTRDGGGYSVNILRSPSN
jgi:hypothetical protein